MINEKVTYLDYAATTPVDPRVLEAMLPYFSDNFGNPSSIHSIGQKAEDALETARESVAMQLNCRPDEIIFTSCGTESDNLALRGMAQIEREKRGANRILISPVEHHAISHTALQLQRFYGYQVEYLPVDRYGMVVPETVAEYLHDDTAVVSTIYANNEIGTINPIAEIGQICAAKGIPFHTDAVQAGAYLPVDVEALHVDSMSIGAHKFYGPKGVGVLYQRKGVSVLSTQTGGGQEFGHRAGTQNIPYIVGLSKALELVTNEREKNVEQIMPLRDRIIGTVLEEIPEAELTGHPSRRLPNHASFVFRGIDGNKLLMALDSAGFACSSGSACKTGDPEPSDVLTAIGLERDWALGSLRVTLGKGSQPADVDRFLNVLPGLIKRLRSI
jgi:cysteine desulfurase